MNNNTINLFNIRNEIIKEEKKLNWKKIPQWTKVQVKQQNEDTWKNRYYLGYSGGNKPFLTTPYDKFIYMSEIKTEVYECCRLDPLVKIKEEWYK